VFPNPDGNGLETRQFEAALVPPVEERFYRMNEVLELRSPVADQAALIDVREVNREELDS
jgi:hypothetical protein